MISRREWDRFLEALEDEKMFVEDLCIEVEVDGCYEVIDDLPGVEWCDEFEEGIDLKWDWLSQFPAVEEQVIEHYNTMAAIDEADRYTRRAEQGFCNY